MADGRGLIIDWLIDDLMIWWFDDLMIWWFRWNQHHFHVDRSPPVRLLHIALPAQGVETGGLRHRRRHLLRHRHGLVRLRQVRLQIHPRHRRAHRQDEGRRKVIFPALYLPLPPSTSIPAWITFIINDNLICWTLATRCSASTAIRTATASRIVSSRCAPRTGPWTSSRLATPVAKSKTPLKTTLP